MLFRASKPVIDSVPLKDFRLSKEPAVNFIYATPLPGEHGWSTYDKLSGRINGGSYTESDVVALSRFLSQRAFPHDPLGFELSVKYLISRFNPEAVKLTSQEVRVLNDRMSGEVYRLPNEGALQRLQSIGFKTFGHEERSSIMENIARVSGDYLAEILKGVKIPFIKGPEELRAYLMKQAQYGGISEAFLPIIERINASAVEEKQLSLSFFKRMRWLIPGRRAA